MDRLCRTILNLLTVGGLLLAAGLSSRPVKAEPPVSLFGYSWNDGVAYTWEEIGCDYNPTGGCDPLRSRFNTRTIDIGFSFPFFENSYSQVTISPNGFIAFGYLGAPYPTYFPMPSDYTPNNLVAAFWQSLVLNSSTSTRAGKVFYKSLPAKNPDRLIIQYNQVGIDGIPGSSLTFQIILKSNGDIIINYNSLTGDLVHTSVGIEDGDGLDGLQYVYNSSGLSGNKAIRFIYPTATPRYAVKIGPVHQGSLLALMQSYFPLTIYNIGSTPDSFEMTGTVVDGSDWEITFFDQSGVSVLENNRTSLIPSGKSIPIYMKVKVPYDQQETVGIGEFSQIAVSATSITDPSRSATISAQAALPAPFAQSFIDSQAGMNVQFITPRWRYTRPIPPMQIGDKLSMTKVYSTLDEKSAIYILAWQKDSDIEYSLMSFNPAVSTTNPPRKIHTDNGGGFEYAYIYPAVSATPDGSYIGLSFIKQVRRQSDSRYQENVFILIMDSAGTPVTSNPIQITNNTGWHKSGDLNVPRYIFNPFPLSITATDGNQFTITWYEKKEVSGGFTEDLWFAIYNSAGTKTFGNSQLTPASSPAGIHYKSPNTTHLVGNQILLSYIKDDNGEKMAYRILNSAGSTVRAERVIDTCVGGENECKGGPSDAVQLSNGNILLGWVNAADRVVYTVLESDGDEISAPLSLDTPADRTSAKLSVTRDNSDHGILTWEDKLRNDFLFYALVDAVSGDTLTPAMILRSEKRTEGAGQANIFTSPGGMGCARLTEQLIIQYLFIPFIEHQP